MEETEGSSAPGPDSREPDAGREERRHLYERTLRSKLTPSQYERRSQIAQSVEERLRQINESLERLARSLGPDAPASPPGPGPR